MDRFSSFFAVLLLSSGLFITVRLGFFQFTHLPKALKTALFSKGRAKSETIGADKAITPFQAMASALGSSIGTANIAGTAGAIAIGGAGAVFYMWLAALVGMAVKFSEIALAVKYRKTSGGTVYGGPMLYIENGLASKQTHHLFSKRAARALAKAFALFGLLSSCIGTTLVQSNTIFLSSLDMYSAFSGGPAPLALKLFIVLLLTLGIGAVVIGGAKRIGKLSELLVPFMALLYILICVFVLVKFRKNIPSSFIRIFKEAFSFRSACGGAAGCCMLNAMRTGTARGVYSNEAGVGSAPMAHALSNEKSPVIQGYYGIFEVFADTIVMCSLTALVVLSSGIDINKCANASGGSIALCAFASVLGQKSASIFLAFSLLLFAYTSIIGWSVYGLSCTKYLFGERAKLPYCVIFTLFSSLGAFIRADFVWKIGEIFNYLMAFPNMIAVVLLSTAVKREIQFY